MIQINRTCFVLYYEGKKSGSKQMETTFLLIT